MLSNKNFTFTPNSVSSGIPISPLCSFNTLTELGMGTLISVTTKVSSSKKALTPYLFNSSISFSDDPVKL
jgi:hypothetical protein